MPNFYGVAGWGPAGFEDYYTEQEEGVEWWKKSKEFEFIQPYCEKNENDDYPEEFWENIWEAIGEHQHILWDMDCHGDIELYDDDGEQIEYNEDGTPKKDVPTTWREDDHKD